MSCAAVTQLGRLRLAHCVLHQPNKYSSYVYGSRRGFYAWTREQDAVLVRGYVTARRLTDVCELCDVTVTE